jgi:hypothetical protein
MKQFKNLAFVILLVNPGLSLQSQDSGRSYLSTHNAVKTFSGDGQQLKKESFNQN